MGKLGWEVEMESKIGGRGKGVKLSAQRLRKGYIWEGGNV